MTQSTTGSGERDPQHTRIVEEFLRARDEGEIRSVEEFCARFPESRREEIRSLCEQVQGIQGHIGSLEAAPEPLSKGQVLSHYEIVGPLGKGGMGEVYRAKDTKLDREVALKVLPPDMASNPERVKRFDREAKAIAALAHPNIVTLHSVEESDDGLHFITMELIEGETLASRIRKRGLPLEEFFRVAIPMADAVSAAHEQGITHRDLKPANIMVTQEDRVKILDFGLAKLRENFGSEATTQTVATRLTEEGRVVGTAAYMSPEQAEGKAVDHRTDIFSLGIVLYELATGERPFKGDTMASLISSIMRDTPAAVTEVNSRLPNHLGRIIQRALDKDPERRFQTAKDLRNELEALREESRAGLATGARRRRYAGMTLAGAIALLVGYALWGSTQAAATPQWRSEKWTNLPGLETHPTLSPDGKNLVYARKAGGNWDILLQQVAVGRTMNLTQTEELDEDSPAFSPDGKRIAYHQADAGLWIMDQTGENKRQLHTEGHHPAWSPDGTQIAFADLQLEGPYSVERSGLWIVGVDTGEPPRPLLGYGQQPSWSPDGNHIAFWSVILTPGGSQGQRDLFTISPGGGAPTQVTHDPWIDWSPVWSSDGDYLYFASDRGGSMNLWRIRMDSSSGVALGDPEPVRSGGSELQGFLSISRDTGLIAYAATTPPYDVAAIKFDPIAGRAYGDYRRLTEGSRNLRMHLDVSPDGERVVFIDVEPRETVVVIDRDGRRDSERRLTPDSYNERSPTWSPVEDRIAFSSNRSGQYEIWAVNARGGNPTRLSVAASEESHWWPIWSPTGDRLAYNNAAMDVDGAVDRYTTVIIDPNKPFEAQEPVELPWLRGFNPRDFSPDGNFLVGNQVGANGEMLIYSFETKTYENVGPGEDARFMRDGNRLMYFREGILYMQDLETGDEHEALSVKPLNIHGHALSLDETELFFILLAEESDIFVLEEVSRR